MLAHTMITVIAAIWNNHNRQGQDDTISGSIHAGFIFRKKKIMQDPAEPNQVIYSVRCGPGSTFVDRRLANLQFFFSHGNETNPNRRRHA